MKRFPAVRPLVRASLAVLPLFVLGCVPYQTYETVKAERDRLKSANEDLVVKYNRAIQEIMKLRGFETQVATAKEIADNQKRLIDELNAKLQKLELKPAQVADLEKMGIEVGEDGQLVLSEDLMFNSGMADLKSAASKNALDYIVELLQKEHPDEIIHISGHTDTDPLNRTAATWKTNQRLGYERASTVFGYFMSKGIPERRMVLHSYSFLLPRAEGDTKEAKAKNRRVTIGVTAGLKV
jgi:flagellar motor protein MotB